MSSIRENNAEGTSLSIADRIESSALEENSNDDSARDAALAIEEL